MFDSIVFVCILIFMYLGYKKGFRREFSSLLVLMASVIVGIIFHSVLGMLLNLTSLPDVIGGMATENFLLKLSEPNANNGTVNQIFAAMTHSADKRRAIGEISVTFISFLVIFFAAYIVLGKMQRKIKFLQKIQVARQIRQPLGGVVGIFKGFIVVYIFVSLLVVAEPFIGVKFVQRGVEKSEITRFIYEDNYVANVVGRKDYLSSSQK